MIHIEKDFSKVPKELQKQEDKFNSQEFTAKDSYKVIQHCLIDLYNDKCAYCEMSLIERHVEHYRTKKLDNKKNNKCDNTYAYPWLGLSWSNLILCCGNCNKSKGNCFDVLNQRVTYNEETFEELHSITQSYNLKEKPLMIHPEIDNPEPLLIFNEKGEVSSNDERVQYTIRICDLNDENRKQKKKGKAIITTARLDLLNGFKDKLERDYKLFLTKKKSISLVRFDKVLIALEDSFKNDIITFYNDAHNNTLEFLAFRRYMINNYNEFFCSEQDDHFNKFVQLAFLKFLPKN